LSITQDILNGLIEFYGTTNVNELIDEMGIIVIRRDFPDGTKGKFFRDYLGIEYIMVSSGLDHHEEICVLAHELGHAVLHTDLSIEYLYGVTQVKNKYEVQADKFASALLLCDIDIDELEGLTTKEISCHLGVPENLIAYKFG
jgi:Zn-dependent peptidase ImmA (M78 family)